MKVLLNVGKRFENLISKVGIIIYGCLNNLIWLYQKSKKADETHICLIP